jgi:hypothetical protein
MMFPMAVQDALTVQSFIPQVVIPPICRRPLRTLNM